MESPLTKVTKMTATVSIEIGNAARKAEPIHSCKMKLHDNVTDGRDLSYPDEISGAFVASEPGGIILEGLIVCIPLSQRPVYGDSKLPNGFRVA